MHTKLSFYRVGPFKIYPMTGNKFLNQRWLTDNTETMFQKCAKQHKSSSTSVIKTTFVELKIDFFKIFLLDIGLLGAMSNISMDICHPFFTGIFLIDEVFYLLNISVTEQHQAMRFQPVPSGPSDFLVIAFNVSVYI
jgi:hypothetical protein